MTAREIEKILLADGWYHKNTKHPTKPGKVTVPQHKGDLDKGTAQAILEQAGLK